MWADADAAVGSGGSSTDQFFRWAKSLYLLQLFADQLKRIESAAWVTHCASTLIGGKEKEEKEELEHEMCDSSNRTDVSQCQLLLRMMMMVVVVVMMNW